MKERRHPDELLQRLAEEHGTPLYVLDLDRVAENLSALAGFERVRYAQKANGNPALLRFLARAGAAVDAVSAGEIERALATGFAPRDVQYTADLFTPESLALVARHDLSCNLGTLDMIEELAAARPGASVTLRVNPGFGSGHHHGTTTGGALSKHGIWHADLPQAYERARAAGLEVRGLHLHVGSGIDPRTSGVTIAALGEILAAAPATVGTLSAGGGLPTPYRPGEAAFDVRAYTAAWREAREGWRARLGRELALEVEPGRYLVADAGSLLARVRATKRTPGHAWALVDAGFHTLLRPALYAAYHHLSVVGRDREPLEPAIVAGPLCESTDVLSVDREGRPEARLLPRLARGDLVCLHDTGAYGAAMASTYNAQRLPAEVVVERGHARLAVARQAADELLARELPAGPA